MNKITRALISVSDKTGIEDFARALHGLGVEILSTGGTRRALVEGGVEAQEVADYTGFPEMMDGRVKTLHPKVHGGLLGRRDLEDHGAAMAAHGPGTGTTRMPASSAGRVAPSQSRQTSARNPGPGPALSSTSRSPVSP